MRRRDFIDGALGLGIVMTASMASVRGGNKEAAELIARAVKKGTLRAATLEVRRKTFTYRKAFGEAMSSDTPFLIASITKPMTAVGMMVLADRGELSLGDPVHKFISEFQDGDRKSITIQNLLTHTSGLPDQLPENVELRKRQAPLEEFVARAIKTPLLFKPGTRVQYQSMGFLLASEVAQRITKTPFPKFLEQEVFRPLGMGGTALGLGQIALSDSPRSQVEHAEPLYGGGTKDRGPQDTSSWDWNSPYWRNLATPWGGAHSTAPDIAKMLDAFLHPEGKVLKPETAASMIVDQNQGLNEPWGIGFSLKPGQFGRECSPRTFGHGGSTGTIAWADPEADRVCVLLTTLPARVSSESILRPVCDVISRRDT